MKNIQGNIPYIWTWSSSAFAHESIDQCWHKQALLFDRKPQYLSPSIKVTLPLLRVFLGFGDNDSPLFLMGPEPWDDGEVRWQWINWSIWVYPSWCARTRIPRAQRTQWGSATRKGLLPIKLSKSRFILVHLPLSGRRAWPQPRVTQIVSGDKTATLKHGCGRLETLWVWIRWTMGES